MPGILIFIILAVVVLNILARYAKIAGKFEGKEKENDGASDGVLRKLSSSPFLMIQKTKLNGVWMESAGETGLSFLRPGGNSPFPAIGGTVENMQISVTVRESPEDGEFETCYKVLYPADLGLDFYFVKAGAERLKIFAKGKKRWDRLDRELPENVNRESIFLTAKDEKILESFLDKNRKEALFWCLGVLNELYIDDRSVILLYPGIDDTHTELTSRIRLVLQLARTFGTLSEGEKRLYGNRSSLIPLPEEEKKFETTHLKEKTPEIKLPSSPVFQKVEFPGRKEELKEEKAPAFTALPKIEEEKAAGQSIPISPSSPVSPAVPEKSREISPALQEKVSSSEASEIENAIVENGEMRGPLSSSPFSVEVLAEKLFANAFAGNPEKEYFNTLKGSWVQWKGVLQSAYDYSSDFLFGSGGGVKAKILLMEYKKEGAFLTQKIYAVVSFPKSESEFLRNNMNKELVFSGKLFHFEAISKEIMLSEGSLHKS